MSAIRWLEFSRIPLGNERLSLGDEFILVARARVFEVRQDQVDVSSGAGEAVVGGEVEADLLLYRVELTRVAS